jgi:hypothetical protein
MPNLIDQKAEIERDLFELSQVTIQQLRHRWRAIFQTDPPAAFGPDLLRRSIAQRQQEIAFGKLSGTAQRELDRLIALLEKAPNQRLELPRRIKAGAVLVRDWKTKSHNVTVLADGFAYEGHTYASLSEIAREITGTNWNGPRFFGLRPNVKKPTDQVVANDHGHPLTQISKIKSSNAMEAGHGS